MESASFFVPERPRVQVYGDHVVVIYQHNASEMLGLLPSQAFRTIRRSPSENDVSPCAFPCIASGW